MDDTDKLKCCCCGRKSFKFYNGYRIMFWSNRYRGYRCSSCHTYHQTIL